LRAFWGPEHSSKLDVLLRCTFYSDEKTHRKRRRQQQTFQEGRPIADSSFPKHGFTCFSGQKTISKLVKKFGGLVFPREAYASLYGSLKPKASVKREILAFCQKHLIRSCIGLHIRRTDHESLARDRGNFTPDADFRRIAQAAIRKDSAARFFLATDNAKTQQAFEKEFKGRVIVFGAISEQTVGGQKKKGAGAVRHTSLLHAVVDVYLLALCKVVHGSGESSFSTLAERLAESAGNMWAKHVDSAPSSGPAQRASEGKLEGTTRERRTGVSS
jgi:hypothetical protein